MRSNNSIKQTSLADLDFRIIAFSFILTSIWFICFETKAHAQDQASESDIALTLYDEGISAYKKGQYIQAEALFKRSLEFAYDGRSAYYQALSTHKQKILKCAQKRQMWESYFEGCAQSVGRCEESWLERGRGYAQELAAACPGVAAARPAIAPQATSPKATSPQATSPQATSPRYKTPALLSAPVAPKTAPAPAQPAVAPARPSFGSGLAPPSKSFASLTQPNPKNSSIGGYDTRSRPVRDVASDVSSSETTPSLLQRIPTWGYLSFAFGILSHIVNVKINDPSLAPVIKVSFVTTLLGYGVGAAGVGVGLWGSQDRGQAVSLGDERRLMLFTWSGEF